MKKLKCILLVDDNDDDNFFHALVIKEADAAEQIKTVTNGEKAIEYLKKSKEDPINFPIPDLILLDINMPRINGFEFLDKVKAENIIDTNKTVVIVFLTSSLNPHDLSMAGEKYASQIKDYKTKPLDKKMLEEIIEKYFGEQ